MYPKLTVLVHLKVKNLKLKVKSKVKNRPANKDQEVRGQVSTTYLEGPISGLTVGESFFVLARLKFALFQF